MKSNAIMRIIIILLGIINFIFISLGITACNNKNSNNLAMVHKKTLMNYDDCYNQVKVDIDNDDINQCYKLTKAGRNYYYIKYMGVCLAIDDFNHNVPIREEHAFNKRLGLSGAPLNYDAILAWKNYLPTYALLQLSHKIYSDEKPHYPYGNCSSEAD